jgi:hypothetical protein
VKLFDVTAARAEIEGRPPANSANSANPPRGPAGQFAGFAGFATPDAPEANPGPGRAPAGFAGFAGFATPPALETAPPLDPEGLPFAACPACGGGVFWKPASLPFEGPGWACEACHPPPAEGWRHACAVPVAGGTP